MQPEDVSVMLQTMDDPAPVPPVDLTEVSMTPPVPPLPPPPLPPFPPPPALVPPLPRDCWMVPGVQASPTIPTIATKPNLRSWPENFLVDTEVVKRSVFMGVRLAIAA